jgi:transposase
MSFLNKKEVEDLRSQHRLERDRKVCDRIKAVLLYDKGWSYEEIAEALLLSSMGIKNHILEYKNLKRLTPEGGGSSEKLNSKQAKELIDHLDEHTYLYVKDILLYIQSRWQVLYTAPGMTAWLKRHGFSYKKPALVPGKADQEKQEQWIEKYARLKEALPEDETICFIDGVHPTHNVQLAYGWIKKGKRKEIPSNTGRGRLNLSGMIDMLTHKVLVREDVTLNAESTIQFFKKIEEAYPTKNEVHIFCDNARYYKNRAVGEYLEGSKIRLHFLPPYSPNLNPIERLWKWMKERVMYNTYYQEFEDFKQAVLGFFGLLSGLDPGSEFGQQFRSRIRDKFRPLGSSVK